MTTSMRPVKAVRLSLPFQTQQYLRNLIEDGTYQPGQQLPSEGELAESLGISRPTLREALHNLELEGVILRKHGVGTFVAHTGGQRLESGLEVLESIEHIASRSGLNTAMGELLIEERPCIATEQIGLELPEPVNVISVTRSILVDRQPIAFLVDIVLQPYLKKEDLDATFRGSVLDVLLKKGRPTLTYSYTRLAAEVADAVFARKLHIQRHTPLLKLEAKLYSQDGHIVDYSISHFVPGYFDFHVVRRIGS